MKRYLESRLALLLMAASVSAAVCEEIRIPPLTSVSGSPRLPGKFVWADLVTDNVQKVRPFYKELFGWTFLDFGNYAIASKDERPLCGMFQVSRPADRLEARPRWFGYISVASISKAGEAIEKAGGTVLARPSKMPERGEQAVYRDPEGALFGILKSSSGDPNDFLADPGEWIWAELISRDARKAGEFYKKVAGYEVLDNDTTPRANDYVFLSKGYARAAAMTIPADKPGIKPTWVFFVRVKNVQECVGKTESLGGKVLVAPKPELFSGRLAILADPTGAEIGLMEWDEESLKGERAQ